MKKIIAVIVVLTLLSCKSMMENETISKQNINATVDAWHKAAAEAHSHPAGGSGCKDCGHRPGLSSRPARWRDPESG